MTATRWAVMVPMTTPSPSEVFFSYSTASTLILKSPMHAWLKKFGNPPKEPPTPAMLKGTAIHSLILGVGAGSDLVVIDADNYRTKAAQQQRDEVLAAGNTPITMPQMLALSTAAEAIRANLEAQGVKLTGESEVPLEWVEVARNGMRVKCRAKLDHLKGASTVDLKSTADASPVFAARQIYQMGYDIQHAAYTSAVRANQPDMAGREKFTFVFFELEPPYSVTRVRLSGEYRHIGEQRWRRAVDTWAECIASGHWPHYAEDEIEVVPPTYAVMREDAIIDAEGPEV